MMHALQSRIALAAVFILSTYHVASAADWPIWRGPNGDNIAENASPPTEWSASQNIRWQTPLPGEGHATPIIVGNQVIVSLANRQKQIYGLASLNRRTGKVEWSQVAHRGGIPRQIHPKNTHASQTPSSDGEYIFVNYYAGNNILLFCYDLRGNQVWDTKAGPFSPQQYKFGYGSSPVIAGDNVVVVGEHDGAGGSWMRAFDRKTGRPAWSVDRKNTTTFGTPVVGSPGGIEQILIAGGDTVAGYDIASGRQLWSVGNFTTAACGTPAWSGNLVFASGGYPQKKTVAIDATTGQEAWSDNTHCYEQSLLVYDGILYGVDENGILHAWEAETGKKLYRERQGGPQSASPVFAGGHIYTLNEEGLTCVFKPGRTYDEVARNQLGNYTFATPVAVDDVLFYRAGSTDGTSTLYCLSNR